MFREIRKSERITDTCEKKEDLGYLKIKPETDMTIKEAKDFWNKVFESMKEA